MRVLVLINNDEGLYKFRNELLLELLKNNEVYISTPDGPFVSKMVDEGCVFVPASIDRRGINPAKDYKLIRRYKSIIKEVNPDYVITYTVKPNIYGGRVCRKKGIPYAANITGLGTAFQKKGLLKSFVSFLYKSSLKKAKVVFFENSGNRDVFVDEGIVSADKTCVLNGAGVNTDYYSYQEYPDGEICSFIFIGRIMKEKGIEELLEATRRLYNDGRKVELNVLGPFEEDYKSEFEKYQSEGWLKYHGEQYDIKPYVRQAHCFVLPSWHEGMANTNLECASMGRPIITSNIPGCKEAVKDGVSGLLCEKQNSESLYSVMKKFSALGYNDRKAMGTQGRKYMTECFDKKIVVEKTLAKIRCSINHE